MPFSSDRAGSSKKYRTSDSIHSDEDPLMDEELGVMPTTIATCFQHDVLC